MTTDRGSVMRSEIAQQPGMLAALLAARTEVAGVAGAVRRAAPRFVLFAARGTSDHAALYAKYLVEVRLGLPAGLASPSTVTAYDVQPDMREVLFVAVSQSGASPDLVGSLQRARECGALTLAVTNSPASALAQAAELHVDVRAGEERAVAATKTYTAELLALWLLVDSLAGGDGSAASGVPAAVEAMTEGLPGALVAELAAGYAAAQRMIVTGRGYSFPTALEAALKFMETSYLAAQGFSGADLVHGPLAMVDGSSHVIAVVSDGPGGRSMEPVLSRIQRAGARLVVVGTPEAVRWAGRGVPLPGGLPEHLVPIVEIVPLQRIACELAVVRGNDPDQPRGLSKVTLTN